MDHASERRPREIELAIIMQMDQRKKRSGDKRPPHLQTLHAALEEEEEGGGGVVVRGGVDEPLRGVRARLQVAAVQAQEGANDGVIPEQSQPEEVNKGLFPITLISCSRFLLRR